MKNSWKKNSLRKCIQIAVKHLRRSLLWKYLFGAIFAKKFQLRSLIGFSIRHWHHYVNYYYVAIFTANIIFMAASFILLCLLSTCHIRFIQINSSQNSFFLFIMPGPGCLDTILLSHYEINISRESNCQKIDWFCITNDEYRYRYIMACYLIH